MEIAISDSRLDFDDTKLDLLQATSLPSVVYTSDKIFELELERIFYRKWLAVCHSSQFKKTGDVLIRNVGKKSVLIIKGEDGKLRAFHNVCRHRGIRLLTESKNVRAIQCPYHAWTYKLDGELVGCPDMDMYLPGSSFDKEDFPLYPVKLEMWGGFVWINLDANAEPLRSYLGEFAQIYDKYETEKIKWVGSVGPYVVDSNWKSMLENFNECYHCPTVHPETLKPFYREFIPADHSKIHGPYVMLQWKDSTFGGQPQSMTSKRMDTLELSDEDRRTQWLPWVFPNFQFTFTPDWIGTLALWPDGLARTNLEIEYYAYDWSSSADFSEMMKTQDLIIRQDVEILKLQQAGLESNVFDGCKFNKLEESIHSFQKLYADAMGQL